VDAIVTSWYVYIILDLLPGFELSDDVGFAFLTLSQIAFVTSQLTLLHIGKQFMGEFDSQESQVLIQLLLLLKGMFGLDLFSFLDWFTIGGVHLFGLAVVLNLFRAVFESAWAIHVMYRDGGGSKSSKLESVTSFRYQMMMLTTFGALSWICRSRLDTVHWFFLSAFSIADMSNRVLVCRIVQEPTPWFHNGLIVMSAAALVGKDNGVIAGWIFPLIMAILHVRYVVPRCFKFAELLDVYVLTVKRK